MCLIPTAIGHLDDRESPLRSSFGIPACRRALEAGARARIPSRRPGTLALLFEAETDLGKNCRGGRGGQGGTGRQLCTRSSSGSGS